MENRKGILHQVVKIHVYSKRNGNHAFLINLHLNQWSVLEKIFDVQEAFLKEPHETLKLFLPLKGELISPHPRILYPNDVVPKSHL